MKKLLLSVSLSFHGVLFAICVFPVAQGKLAQPLLKFDATRKTFELNRNFLTDIAKLPLPIRVIAIHGDSRVGKSTTLNVLNHVWNGANRSHVEEIFTVGDCLAPVTRGVLAYITKDKEGSVVLLDVEAPDLGDDILVAHIHMFTAMISSGLNILVREHVQNSNLQSLFYLARLNELVFPNSSSSNFPKLRVVVRGGLENPGGRSVEDYTRDSIVGHSFQKSMAEERKIIAKLFPRSEIAVSQIPHVHDSGFLKDFEKLSRSDYLTAVETLATELKGSPIKRTLEGSPMDGVALVELIEQLAETIIANGWLDFENIYHTIESNICKRSEAKFIAPLFKWKSEQIESEEKNILDAFARECRLENGLTSAREKLQQLIHEKKSCENLKMIIAEYESKKVEEVEKRAESEEDFQKKIRDKDKVIAKETKAHKEAEEKAQNLTEKLNTCESRLKDEFEKGWMYAFRYVIAAEIPSGAEFLYHQRGKRKEDAEETNCNKMFDEIKKLIKEDHKRINDLETKYSIRELSEALIKVLSLCSSVMALALQIRAQRR